MDFVFPLEYGYEYRWLGYRCLSAQQVATQWKNDVSEIGCSCIKLKGFVFFQQRMLE